MYFNYAGFYLLPKFPNHRHRDEHDAQNRRKARKGRHFFRMFNGMGDDQRAAAYLNGKSFEQAVLDNTLSTEVFYEMMKLKGVYLRNYINSRLSSNEFKGIHG